MRKIVLLLVLFGLTSVTFGYVGQQDVNEVIIQQADPPQIDGILDADWDPAIPYQRDANIAPSNPPDPDNDPPDDVDPNTVKYRALWNSATNRLYLIIWGEDTIHSFDPVHIFFNSADSLEIYVDANNNDSLDYRSQVQAQQFRIGYDGSGGSWQVTGGGHEADWGLLEAHAVTVDGNTITYEATVVPYAKLILDAGNQLDPGQTIIKTLGVDDIVGFDVDFGSRFGPILPDGFSKLGMSPDSTNWRDATKMLDQKLGPGDTSRAYDPYPANRATGVDKTMSPLTWKAGTQVNSSENVYFGTSSGSLALIGIKSSVTPHSAQSQSVTSYHPFDLGESYFWRIDDINGPCTVTGYEWRYTITGSVENPVPYDLTVDLPRDVTLSWTAGQYAEVHKIYFGTDETLVTDSDASVYIGEQVVADVNIDRTNLTLDTTYYWKIVELSDSNTTVVDGPVWEFTVAPYIIIEDYETYTGTADLQANWVVGGCAVMVVLSPSVYYSPSHSMQMLYQNDFGSYNAYARHDLGGAQDWTIEDVKALSIMFKGSGTNAGDDIYVELESNDGAQSGRQQFGDTTATQDPGWNEWFIDMGAFGIDLNNVTKITLGIGQNPGQSTGSGGMTFDFITIALPRLLCTNQPTADVDGDCDVDGVDLKEMVDVWLDYDETRYSPFDGSLENFEDNGAVADSQWANPGLIFNDDANKANWNDWVDIDDYVLDNFYNKTVVCWATQNAGADSNDRYIFGPDFEYRAYIMLNADTNEICGAVGPQVINKVDCRFGYTSLTLGQEYFLALVIPTDPNDSTFYVDGISKGDSNVPDTTKMTRHTAPRLLGACLGGYSDNALHQNAGPFTIKDFRIYDFDMNSVEIATLYGNPAAFTTDLLRYQMNETTGLVANDSCILARTAYQPLVNEDAELNGEAKNSKKINMFDYAVLAGQWGDNGMSMWP